MEYHSDRFIDHSLMVFDDRDRLLALLPANLTGETLYSHQGLTFGGFVIGYKVTTEIMLEIFSILIDYMRLNRIEKLIYKSLPSVYAKAAAQEDLYALFANGALLLRRDISSTIELNEPFKYSKGRKWTLNKAKKEDFELYEETEYAEFWKLLREVLSHQHDAKPVHSLSEIEYLKDSFPANIKLYVAKKGSEVMAGAVIYETELVAHAQYLANSDRGREVGALDFLLDHLIKSVYKEKKYFDFGISTEQDGRLLNKGLIAHKEGFGAIARAHDIYELEVI